MAYSEHIAMHPEDVTDFVLEFSCDNYNLGAKISTALTYKRFRYLVRHQYVDAWNRCEAGIIEIERFSEDNSSCLSPIGLSTATQTILVGTAGIGKSAMKLYIISKWLEEGIHTWFDHILFNDGPYYYRVDRTGEVSQVTSREARGASQALWLLDACELLSEVQYAICKMLIVFASPSTLLGQSEKPSLKQLVKCSRLEVLEATTELQARMLYPDIDPARFESLSSERNGTRFCSLRWLTYRPSEIPFQIYACYDDDTTQALKEWLVTNKADRVHKDPRLPYRLCVVEPDSVKGWVVTGFISPVVETIVVEWALRAMRLDRDTVLNVLENRMCRGALGIIFKKWLFDFLGEQEKRLTVVDKNGGGQDRVFTFRTMQSIVPNIIGTESDILYKVDHATYPSIDGYAIHQGRTLLFLQSTISDTHRAARYDDVKSIVVGINAAFGDVDLLVVYVTPSGVNFRVPGLVGFPEHAEALWGYVDDSTFKAMSSFKAVRMRYAWLSNPAILKLY